MGRIQSLGFMARILTIRESRWFLGSVFCVSFWLEAGSLRENIAKP